MALVIPFLTVWGCKDEEKDLTVYLPDGAPAMAFAGLMAEDIEEDGVVYKVVPPSLIASKVTNEDETKNADLCVLPLTVASKLLGSGERYTMLGTVTHGNLYLLAKKGTPFVGLSDLLGKTVGTLQMNEVPGLTLKASLQSAGIAYKEVTNEGSRVENTVNLLPISGADAVGVTEADFFLIAEPAASAQAKKGYEIVGDLQALYKGGKGYPQAVLLAKNELIEERSDWTKGFAAKVETSSVWLESASGEEIVRVISSHLEDESGGSSLKAALLTETVVAGCGIRFAYAAEERNACEEFLSDLKKVNDKAGAIPAEKFYWSYTN